MPLSPARVRLRSTGPFWLVSLIFVLACHGRAPKPAPVAQPAATDSKSAASPEPARPTSNDGAMEEDEDEVTGKSLYARHCAGCHNDNGDGRGATMLAQGKQARSFAQGGFAFGNTVDAIVKTMRTGIPGSSLMPSFSGLMDDDELRMVAEHVLTLTPYRDLGPAGGSKLAVVDRARFVRGKLPSAREGLPERPRGLLIGLRDGWSVECRTDDLRCLALRRGEFVDRRDWNDRGGAALAPLGEVVHLFEGGDPSPWIFTGGAERRALVLRLAATRVIGNGEDEVQVESRPAAAPAGAEPGVASRSSDPGGLRRVIETWRAGPPAADLPALLRRRIVLDVDDRVAGMELVLLAGTSAKIPVRGGPAAPLPADGWWILPRNESFLAVHIASSAPLRAEMQESNWRIAASIERHTGAGPLRFEVAYVALDRWDDSVLVRLTQELSR